MFSQKLSRYIPVFSCSNPVLQYAYQMQISVWIFTFFGIKNVWKSMEFDVSVGV